MVGKYKVINLCGSTKFKEQYLEAQKRLTLEGSNSGRIPLPISFQFHHTQMDGGHAAKFLANLQNEINGKVSSL